jgi:type II secretory pathway component PulF
MGNFFSLCTTTMTYYTLTILNPISNYIFFEANPTQVTLMQIFGMEGWLILHLVIAIIIFIAIWKFNNKKYEKNRTLRLRCNLISIIFFFFMSIDFFFDSVVLLRFFM